MPRALDRTESHPLSSVRNGEIVEGGLGGEGRGSHVESAYEDLRALILEGVLRPGDPIREGAVAARLGVSRTPVRDALQRLLADGLLTRGGPRGLAVRQLDQQQIVELFALREVLEGMAARLAARHASEPEIRALRDLVRRQRDALLDSPALQNHLNNLFHHGVAEAARNRYLAADLKERVELSALMAGTGELPHWRRDGSVDEHERTVDAIERRDGNAAAAIAAAHARASCELRLVLLFGGDGQPTAGAPSPGGTEPPPVGS
jgi:DNA-binding GntR family transcriptional regulator